jgi:hypothetical protein
MGLWLGCHHLRPLDRLCLNPESRMQRRTTHRRRAVRRAAGRRAHHGWSSFDQNRPIYLEGTARKVRWRNPHAELKLELPADLKLPADLASRRCRHRARRWTAWACSRRRSCRRARTGCGKSSSPSLTRMNAWKVPEIKNGDNLGVLGFTFTGERGDAILRAEYLFVGGQVYGLRSSPA